MKSFKYLIFLLPFLASCAHTRNSGENHLSTFETSGSFCIDAYVANSRANGCLEWSTRNVSGIGEIRCTSPVNSENNWLSSTFVFFPSSSNPPPEIPRFQPLCVDSQVIFGKIILQ